ncbi:hypothetical protein BW730_14315 [Tessaracoccus aquimaris]|uniref:Uncharacterized protein n=1 Tax=Tessaracoccus aquimaris TaxID=1332264 RepID=A0A1Q2CQX2_9ACTN|nr:hypothetical protein [Tessaracoccus aquimaris]AQP48507.1 hypothetical protein BW730_14315 [Tessaracoccus aquimaris]
MEIIYNSGNQGPVFALKESAEHVWRINEALESAKTWGELRRLLPEEEWSEVIEMWPVTDDEGNPVVVDGKPLREFEEGQEDDEPFEADDFPGVADGDYPTWLQQEMEDWMPAEIVDEYATVLETRLNGEALMFRDEDTESIADALRALGHTVTWTDRELV